MFYKNIALVLFCSLLSIGGITHAANVSFEVVINNSDPKMTTDEDKPKPCNKILKEAAKKQCVKKQQEEANKEADKKESVQEVSSQQTVKAQTKPQSQEFTAEKYSSEEDEELITPMFGRTLYNFLKSLML